MRSSPRSPSGNPAASASPLLFLVVEGLRPDDISRAHSPFLQRLRWNSLIDALLVGAAGEQVWGEVFAGVWPERSGALAPWALDPAIGLPMERWKAQTLGLLDRARRSSRVAASLLSGRRNAKGNRCPPPARLPLGLAASVRQTDCPSLYLRPGSAPLPSLFDSLLGAGRRVEETAFPTSPAEERRLVSRLGYMGRAFLDRHDLYIARLPGLERLAFHHPPGSPERFAAVRDLDAMVERIVSRFRRMWPEGLVMVASLRGAVAARTYFDAAGQLMRTAARHGFVHLRDYALLVDRTMIRAWAFTQGALEHFRMILGYDRHLKRHGRILTTDLAKRHRLPLPGTMAGDWIWMARPGVIVYPNDHDLRRPRAASGYLHLDATLPGTATPAAIATEEILASTEPGDPRRSDCGLMILSAPPSHPLAGNEIRGTMWRVDLCSTLARLLDVPAPAAAQGGSVL